jgi:peptide-methionine (R)-S-oxide reductase
MSSDEPIQSVEMSDEQWRQQLDSESFAVLREAATEPAFTGAYLDEKGVGMFRCKGCNAELFSSDTKFDSGTGWPSFTDPVVSDAVTLVDDDSHGMRRTEACCSQCGGHLGHVFEDGPGASGQRWCINSAALDFEERE